MDVLELLKADHDRVTALFHEAENSDSAKKKKVIFDSIRNELEVHTFVEETIFYPAFKNYPECQSFLGNAFNEHGDIKKCMKDVSALGADDASALQSKLDELVELVSKHVNEEENEFFPIVRRLMKRPERETLGRHIDTAKNERQAAA